MELRLNSPVVSVTPSSPSNPRPSITLASGEVMKGDLIIGCDGVKSCIREVVLGKKVVVDSIGKPFFLTLSLSKHHPTPQPTDDAAYRAILPTYLMLQDPELHPSVETPETTAGMAPGRHLMAYNIVSSFLPPFSSASLSFSLPSSLPAPPFLPPFLPPSFLLSLYPPSPSRRPSLPTRLIKPQTLTPKPHQRQKSI
ncbi:hypothetical protein JAAARDRAFT_201268 [Jaapia argillacea MUCL 33604]|uniref:FAD-binding domain-containing protein n=1 Tax=Jaapia argillacea MUCL 33604 TaxID=933084 RepID=A0A067PES9_9AGAM|nr:hypothetical protein JAAARDRAFT_201268 [Jaapia argillacea MUCL 33604]